MIVKKHPSGNYSQKKSREHLVRTILFVIVYIVLLLISTPRLPTHIIPVDFDNAVTLFTVVPAIWAYHHYKLYRDYKGGIEGEKRVTQLLKEKFDGNYYLINDIEYVYDEDGHKANIDHIVLGTNGIFAIETKNWKGEIIYREDRWSLSPSQQAIYNFNWVKKKIDASGILNFKVYVHPVVVFSNPKAKLIPVEPIGIVDVVELKDLPELIRNKKISNFSPEELKKIVDFIMKKN
ncbi:NERD domain-containing protein [Candidatus Bathyarchaeota archaeon]|nr:NERD domain-containing protein [Candidatus Bathyarchaeota archaeon]